MGTRWRGLLAPIDTETGDGRRMAAGAITHRTLPLPLKWQRTDEAGHDASVVVGLIDTIDVRDDQAYGEGELFDDIDPQTMPRLAEDVAEVLTLLGKGAIGPSVDAGAASAIEVVKGTDQAPTEEQWEAMWAGGDDAPELELLFTHYEIAAATLVSIPAFAEARPFELFPAEDESPGEDIEAEAAEYAALVASLTASAPVPDASWFADPGLDEVTAFHHDPETGRVWGHLATLDTCHVAFKGMCVSPPESVTDYALFHRYVIDTDTGILDVGRITTGHGTTGSGCQHSECQHRDDHACGRYSFAVYLQSKDVFRTIAHIRVGVDEKNSAIWFAGVADASVTADDLAVMDRRKVSGDWRAHGGNLELTELLALSVSEPGFPLPVATSENGRQVALVAAAPVTPRDEVDGIDYTKLGKVIAAELKSAGLTVADVAVPVGTEVPTIDPTVFSPLRKAAAIVATATAARLTKGQQ